MALPSRVRVDSRCTDTIATTAMPMIASWLPVRIMPANVYEALAETS